MNSGILTLALLDGVSYAGMLFIVSLGLTFIFGVTNILNVAHGSLYACGGYATASIGLWLMGNDGGIINSIFSIIAGTLLVGVIVGLILEYLLRFFEKKPPILQLIITFAFFMILEDVQRLIWGTSPYFVSTIVGEMGNVEVLGVFYTNYQLIVLPGAAVIIYFILNWFLKHSLLGKKIVAVTHNKEVAVGMGVDAKKIKKITFIIGGLLGAFGGALASPTTSMVPGISADIIVLSFAVVATAGLGQVTGALIAALIIGIFRSLSIYLYPELEVVIPYVIMGTVLLFKPQGLFTVEKARRI
ncbi:branched-chain amino acid ABC transporter permease [Marinobacterium rhizophilum]|uniref:branched-chain amino acid ABC transporter permease n=1 Tax=Marinobacterium rhizophilum TaxID=420402 RepID=UPI00047668EB|nr:branched-chain amino acid ABC transporter permease [Marinobacterium rhizophilum]